MARFNFICLFSWTFYVTPPQAINYLRRLMFFFWVVSCVIWKVGPVLFEVFKVSCSACFHWRLGWRSECFHWCCNLSSIVFRMFPLAFMVFRVRATVFRAFSAVLTTPSYSVRLDPTRSGQPTRLKKGREQVQERQQRPEPAPHEAVPRRPSSASKPRSGVFPGRCA